MGMGGEYHIRTGTWDDEPKVGALMALAFATDPFVRWILQDPQEYVAESLIHAGVTTAPAFDNGTVYMIGDAFGAAVWVPPDAEFQRSDAPADDASDMPEEMAELIQKSGAYRPSERRRLFSVSPSFVSAWLVVILPHPRSQVRANRRACGACIS